ncbi:hypothetical protein WME73_37515 [Sorangium sp. So ce302]|uniref:hypothetical protein n=1 Tax=unclassified Sorangium TaxID=2621164 RepID=UPI003F605CE6
MRNPLLGIAATLLFAAGCTTVENASLSEHVSASADALTEEECSEYLDPAFGDCNEPVDPISCQSIDWDKDREPTGGYACFGFKRALDTCRSCNRLNLPMNEYSLCKNKQYMDCLMSGYLNDHGPLCFVTPLAAIDVHAPRATPREACYYLQQTGTWPPPCPTESACPGPCECTGGTDYLGNPVSATCGENICGADHQFYDCSQGQWAATGAACGGSCQCTGGTNYLGNPVTASCGQSVCGADYQFYDCVQGQWVAAGVGCAGSCQCTGGTDYLGNPVSASCGQSVCGADYQFYDCVQGQWVATGSACGGSGG